MEKSVRIFEAKQALNKFLNENPHLKPMQAKIDSVLKGAVNQNNRIVLLQSMITENLTQLTDALKDLQECAEKYDISKLGE